MSGDKSSLRVAVTRRLPEPVESKMRELFDVRLNEDDHRMDRDELLALMQDSDVIVPSLSDRIDGELLEKAGERLKLIANYGVGVDHIDLPGAGKRGILVTNTSGVLTEDTADMTMALIIAVTRKLNQGMAVMQSGEWEGWSPTAFLGGRIGGRKLGILGMGRIGRAVARRARAFGMEIHYHNRNRLDAECEKALQASWWDSLDQMLARVDVVSVNVAHTPATFHLLSARRLHLLQPGAVVINTSRGEVIDENALTRMLRAGEIAGAGLDVYEHGHEANPRLRNLPNVVLLPHMGSATVEGRIEMGEKVILNIRSFAEGQLPPDLLSPGGI
ncbi:2-hydroxyacid dehydrogenase [Paracoccus aerodenitrificans]|uniref:2-hydroxyacid dehydrogenase n=1 Tax=Paracoccus aerodenitrificans TaxID=3017781 RepID=UPI0022F03F6D|nr:D-glycerate dehydrogenase [Paracoccus aerodenitrificans]WBU62758.1 D-glycerate dehydrogenase [Paracoccus aerodenitrificans]